MTKQVRITHGIGFTARNSTTYQEGKLYLVLRDNTEVNESFMLSLYFNDFKQDRNSENPKYLETFYFNRKDLEHLLLTGDQKLISHSYSVIRSLALITDTGLVFDKFTNKSTSKDGYAEVIVNQYNYKLLVKGYLMQELMNDLISKVLRNPNTNSPRPDIECSIQDGDFAIENERLQIITYTEEDLPSLDEWTNII